jgi:hypothetical protein
MVWPITGKELSVEEVMLKGEVGAVNELRAKKS